MVLGLLFLIILLLIAGHLVEIAQGSTHAPTFQSWSVYRNGRVGSTDSVRTKALSVFPVSDAGCRHDRNLGLAAASEQHILDFLAPFQLIILSIREYPKRSANRSVVALAQRNTRHSMHCATGTFSQAFGLGNAAFAERHSSSVRQLIQPDDALTPRSILENRIRKKAVEYA